MLHNILQKDIKEEDFELCRYLWWRTGVDLNEDADVLFKGYKLGLEFVVVGWEVIDFVELLAGSLDEASHEDVESVLAV